MRLSILINVSSAPSGSPSLGGIVILGGTPRPPPKGLCPSGLPSRKKNIEVAHVEARISLGSVITPVMAEAAAVAGLDK